MEHVIDDVFVGFTAEGRLAAKHNVHDYTHRPDIALRRVTAFQDLRSDVVRGSVRLVHDLVGDNTLRKSKINELDMTVVVFFVEQEVLRLDVTVANAVGVQITKGVERLFHYRAGLLLSQMLLLGYVVKQLAAFAEPKHVMIRYYLLGDQEANSVCFPCLEQLDDVGVVKRSQNANLVLEGLIIGDSTLLHCLDCNLFT